MHCSTDLTTKDASAVVNPRRFARAFSIMALLAFLTVLAGPDPVVAGGSHYLVDIIAFTRIGDGEAVFKLQNRDPDVEELMPGCARIRVSASYRISMLPWMEPDVVSLEKHALALDLLEAAFRADSSLLFGMMGVGLLREPDDPRCSYQSNALSIIGGNGRPEAVYSFHKRP